jgi:hypothetical protein
MITAKATIRLEGTSKYTLHGVCIAYLVDHNFCGALSTQYHLIEIITAVGYNLHG